MTKNKLFIDPVYGLIRFPFPELYQIIDHPKVQRLRRIAQVGLTHLVYPGSNHNRFGHALGALHLMTKVIEILKEKGIRITEEEEFAVCAAILLHDIGHGPYSHTLEYQLINVSHEKMGIAIMHALNIEMDGILELAIAIFEGTYNRKFLHQLVSSQIDMDRLDYLNRDSFYTGVAEGVIGYDRIIQMLNVVDNELVIEEKALYSIEDFLTSRRIMYWQVYLHKTCISAEQMMLLFVKQLRKEWETEKNIYLSEELKYFLQRPIAKTNINTKDIEHFGKLDDYDIVATMKSCQRAKSYYLQLLADGILSRKLFKIIIKKSKFDSDFINSIRQNVVKLKHMTSFHDEPLEILGKVSHQAYDQKKNPIKVLLKSNKIVNYEEITDSMINSLVIEKHYFCFPKTEQYIC